MKKYQGDAILKGSLEVLSNKPLDSRLIVLAKEDLYTLDSNYAYEGMSITCVDEASIYILIDKDRISSSEGWLKVSSGRPTFVMSLSAYERLTDIDKNAIYFLYEDEDEEEDDGGWVFGDEFPATLSGDTWGLEDGLPIILT